jgi:hypothetical protein
MRGTLLAIALIAIVGGAIFWQVKYRSISFLNRLVDVAPVSRETQEDWHALIDMADFVLQTDGQERVFLVLFQNNFEIRPGGGYIGSFGILKIRDGRVTDFASHDTNVFDGRIPSIVPPPYPMKETLKIDSWKMRDSNYSPDFAENAKQAEYFYHLGDGRERFDGVVAITTSVLKTFLEATGPVTVPGYPGEYAAEDAVISLERQVEHNYRGQGQELGERKAIMTPLAQEILRRVKDFDVSKQYALFQAVLDDMHRKDIQLSFRDEWLQGRVERAHWDGKVDTLWKQDYFLTVDANLAAWKSDYVVRRSADYTVDFRSEKPQATLAITYDHTAEKKDWMTNDYQTYLRVYVPDGSWLRSVSGNVTEPVFGEEFGKKYVGVLVHAKIGETKVVTFEYDLPETITEDSYALKIQKQAGLRDTPVAVRIIGKDGAREERTLVLNRDFAW